MKVTYRISIGRMVASTLVALVLGAVGVVGMSLDRGPWDKMIALAFFPLAAYMFAHVFVTLTVEPGAISFRTLMGTRRYESGNVIVSIQVDKVFLERTRVWLVVTDAQGESPEWFLVNDVGRRKRVKLLVDVSAALDKRLGGVRLIPWWPSID